MNLLILLLISVVVLKSNGQGLIPMLTGQNVPENEKEIDAPMYDTPTLDGFIGTIRSKNQSVSYALASLGSDFVSTLEPKTSGDHEDVTTISS